MSFREKLKFRYNKLIENRNLDTPHKLKLIETLLIVGSILVALKTPQGPLLVDFMFFVLLSIFYYTTIQKDKSEPSIWQDIIVLFIAATFSTLVNVNLFIGFDSTPLGVATFLGKILYFAYYSALTLVLWAALVKR